MKRSTWLDILMSMADVNDPVSPRMRQALSDLDQKLFELWNLGEKIILVWSHDQSELRLLAIPHYEILQASHSDVMNAILAGPKFLPAADFDRTCELMGSAAQLTRVRLASDDPVPSRLISSLVTRYGVTLVRGRAVVLLDIVGFSLRSPLEQVAMLNSLSYSVNSAYSQLTSKDIQINFARTTTGDGFYIWNRAGTRDANVALYKLMMLMLADNAVAHKKAKDFPVPQLRAAFHIGEHYEFYQVEALNPTTFGYIVGPVTVELARMISGGLAEQIVIGDFNFQPEGRTEDVSAVQFVADTAATLDQLKGLGVSGDRIRNIRCYLTGANTHGGGFNVTPFNVTDKHGLSHTIYNAKINIHLAHGESIFLGIQHKDVPLPEAVGSPNADAAKP